MKKIFREYHQFTEQEFQQLWKDCLFVFDTNTLLNMYRYSRETVDTYFDILNELKKRKQLWIPYQVGYEFYENRIDVISEYEKSYDEILKILEQTKADIQTKYKNHPFLDLVKIKEDMDSGLKKVEEKIKKQKEAHPRWLEKDEVLENLNKIFDNIIGRNYNESKLTKIKKDGEDRYKKNIPPGFKDAQKPEDKRYGDLIIWYQIIDRAKETKKPIILISGDVKEDWWLEKDGKRIMPLPQLKKEMREKAAVDFHIYTADRFLEYYKTITKETKKIGEKTIKEVRKIRELEEERMMRRRTEMIDRNHEISPRIHEGHIIDCLHIFEAIQELMILSLQEPEIHPSYKDELERLFYRIKEDRNRLAHGEANRPSLFRFYRNIRESLSLFDRLSRLEEINPKKSTEIRAYIERIERLSHRINMFF